MTAPTALAFFWLVVGMILGAASATAFWWLWAWDAMAPHDFPKTQQISVCEPTSRAMRWKTAEELASDLGWYAERAAEVPAADPATMDDAVQSLARKMGRR